MMHFRSALKNFTLFDFRVRQKLVPRENMKTESFQVWSGYFVIYLAIRSFEGSRNGFLCPPVVTEAIRCKWTLTTWVYKLNYRKLKYILSYTWEAMPHYTISLRLQGRNQRFKHGDAVQAFCHADQFSMICRRTVSFSTMHYCLLFISVWQFVPQRCSTWWSEGKISR